MLTSVGSSKNTTEFQKNIYFCLIAYAKIFVCEDHSKLCKNSSRDGNTKPPDLSPEKFVLEVRKQQSELDVEQQTGSKSGKEYVKAVSRVTIYNIQYKL